MVDFICMFLSRNESLQCENSLLIDRILLPCLDSVIERSMSIDNLTTLY